MDLAEITEMHLQLAERLPDAEAALRPPEFTDASWNDYQELLVEGRKTLDLLTRFTGGK